jgi:hypothetical protein
LTILFQIGHGELAIGIEDQLSSVALFDVQITWYAPIIKYLEDIF